MAKVSKEVQLAEEALAFEMIELACNEMDSLSRAFEMINDLCTQLQSDVDELNPLALSKFEIN
jgi:hypothetical protein